MKRRYLFVNDRKRLLVGLFDRLGDVLTKPLTKRGEDLTGRQFKNILIISLDLLGDCVFATPLPAALKEKFPEARVTVLVNERYVEVFAHNPSVDATIAFDTPWFPRNHRKTSLGELRGLGAKLANLNFDLVIDPRGDMRHNYLMALAGIPVRLGYGSAGGGFWLTHEVEYPGSGHRVERNMGVLEPLGITVAKPVLSVYPALRTRDSLAASFGDSAAPIVVIHPFSSCQSKRWPPARYEELAARLIAEHGCRVVLVGSAGEKAEAERIAENIGERLTDVEAGGPGLSGEQIAASLRLLCGSPISELMALIAAANLYIGNDSGPLHLAVAAAVPAIAIYSGENDPADYGPYGEDVSLLYHPVSCAPCARQRCNDHRCMEGISVAAVMAAAAERLPTHR